MTELLGFGFFFLVPAEALFKTSNGSPEGLTQLGQLARAEKNQKENRKKEQMCEAELSHAKRLARILCPRRNRICAESVELLDKSFSE